MVDRSGGCRVRFNLPATHTWREFWITRPRQPGRDRERAIERVAIERGHMLGDVAPVLP